MAKEYGYRKQARRGCSLSKQLLLVLVGFLFGYLSASIFDFTSFTNWFNTQILAQHPSSTTIKATPQQAQLPKPKFEFYTLLASQSSEASVPTASAPAAANTTAVAQPTAISVATSSASATKNPPVAGPLANVVPTKQLPNEMVMGKDAYLVQIAAFKSKPEAERMKAALALKGFAVNIAIVNQQQISWYRVSIGPFTSRILAQKAQAAVANSEHIVGMIRKMDA